MKNTKKIFIGLLFISKLIIAGPAKITKEDIAKLKAFRFENLYTSQNPERISSFSADFRNHHRSDSHIQAIGYLMPRNRVNQEQVQNSDDVKKQTIGSEATHG